MKRDENSGSPACSPLFLTFDEWHRLVTVTNDHVVELQKLEESESRPWDAAAMMARYPAEMRLMNKLLYEWAKPE